MTDEQRTAVVGDMGGVTFQSGAIVIKVEGSVLTNGDDLAQLVGDAFIRRLRLSGALSNSGF